MRCDRRAKTPAVERGVGGGAAPDPMSNFTLTSAGPQMIIILT
jgi:hypothetical protein